MKRSIPKNNMNRFGLLDKDPEKFSNKNSNSSKSKAKVQAQQSRVTSAQANSSKFLVIAGFKTGNKLTISNTEVSYGTNAAYDQYEFMGRPETHWTYKSSNTKSISLSFDLHATSNDHFFNSEGKNNWEADFEGLSNNMGPKDVYNCSNWLLSLNKPYKDKWSPPERVLLNIPNFVNYIECFVTDATKAINEANGFWITDEGHFAKTIKISLSLTPSFDLHKVPFAEEYRNGKFQG